MPAYAYRGEPKQLAARLMPLAISRGKSLCRYPCETEKIEDAKVIAKAMQAEDDLILALYDENNAMAYTKKQMEQGLQIVLNERQKTWKMSDVECADWKETMCRRIRNMCRCISQKLSNKRIRTKPRWLQTLNFLSWPSQMPPPM